MVIEINPDTRMYFPGQILPEDHNNRTVFPETRE